MHPSLEQLQVGTLPGGLVHPVPADELKMKRHKVYDGQVHHRYNTDPGGVLGRWGGPQGRAPCEDGVKGPLPLFPADPRMCDPGTGTGDGFGHTADAVYRIACHALGRG